MAPPSKTLALSGRSPGHPGFHGIPPGAHLSLRRPYDLLSQERQVVLLQDDAAGLSWIPGACICFPRATALPSAPHQPKHLQHLWGRIGQGVVVVNAVMSEVEALMRDVEPELAACGAVMVAYVACASVFFSLFL